MALRLRALVVVVVASRGLALVNALASSLLGVEPGNEATYGGSTFTCLDGSGSALPASVINDEACDCADGSDEPGTGACAGQDSTLFFCKNTGSIPRRLYASRVGDGVCDCCDGSDEASLATRHPSAKCADRCTEEGAVENLAREQKVEMLRRALKKKEAIRNDGTAARTTMLADMESLKSELTPIETALEAAKALADEERKVEADRKAAEEAAKPKPKSGPEGCMWRQTSGCVADGEREASNDKACSEGIPKGNSGFCDCNGDGVKGDEEVGYTCELDGDSTELRQCVEVCEAAPKEDSPKEDAAGEEEKPQAEEKVTSEYAKWMDDSEKVQAKKEDDAEPAKAEEKVTSEYAKWMDDSEKVQAVEGEKKADDAGAADAEEGNDAALDASGEEAEEKGTNDEEEPEKEAESSVPKEETAVDKETAAQTKVTAHKEKIEELQGSLDSITAESLGYASLRDNKLTKQVAEHMYSIEFFKTAHQESVSLGSWSKWTGPRTAVFDDGTMCWGGPARKLNVHFVCGETEQILDVFEPSRCVYQATVEHPGACDQEDLDILVQGKQVVGPRDEL